MKGMVAFVSGLLFALGLGLGGMTEPAKVIGFLDVAGNWDPSLALVMGGALLVYALVARFALTRSRPLLDDAFHVPTRRDVDARLVVGALLFGAGWGIAGYCPGPAMVALASGRTTVLAFVAAMLLGMWIQQRWKSPRALRAPAAPLPRAVALVALSLLAGDASRASGAPTPVPGIVRADMLVDTGWLAANLELPGLVVLHVGKTREEFDRGHVPGARFVAFGEVATTRDGLPNELPPLAELGALVRRLGITGEADERIVIYGEDEGLSAARVFVALDYLGLAGRAALLDGQWAAWQAESRPVSTAAAAVPATSVVPRVRPERLVARRAVEDLSYATSTQPSARVALVDARPAAQFAGTEAGDGVARPGHIPGAVGAFWRDDLQSGDVPRLRPAHELRARYAALGVAPDDLVVTYCRTGAQAAHSYFVLRYLGHDVRLYDGSFVEWSAAPETAVVRTAAEPSRRSEDP